VGAPEVHLIDAPVLVFRAWFALPDMRSPSGEPVNAAYGVTGSLIRWLAERQPTHVACCFDHAITSFRNRLFPGYKASRGDEVPPELAPQFELCKEAARALGVAVYEAADYEADDVIATLAAQQRAAGADVLVVSSDKDLCQLVSEDGAVALHDLRREERVDADGVRARFGVSPRQVPDYLCLLGDKVDDLPGVPGFGRKTTAALLSRYARLEEIPSDPAQWAAVGLRGVERLALALAEHRERAVRVRELATLVSAVPGLSAGLADLAWSGADQSFHEVCVRLGWGRMPTRVPRWKIAAGS
jgi:5'-3' exonuclease